MQPRLGEGLLPIENPILNPRTQFVLTSQEVMRAGEGSAPQVCRGSQAEAGWHRENREIRFSSSPSMKLASLTPAFYPLPQSLHLGYRAAAAVPILRPRQTQFTEGRTTYDGSGSGWTLWWTD
jgi:hypothetical protein